MRSYCLIVIPYKQRVDFLNLSNDSIRIPKIILVIIKPFYNRTAVKAFCDMAIATRTLQVFMCHGKIKADSQLKNTFLRDVKLRMNNLL